MLTTLKLDVFSSFASSFGSVLKLSLLATMMSLVIGASPSFAAGKTQVMLKKNIQQEKVLTKVNLNKGSAEDLATVLKGVGLKKAEAIVKHREKHGKFKRVEDLSKVKGIGESILEKNRDRITL